MSRLTAEFGDVDARRSCERLPDGSCPGGICVLRCSCVEFHRSAFRHGIAVEAIAHALGQRLVTVDLDVDGDPPQVLGIGPDLAGNLLEIVWLELADERRMVIHAMPLRASFYGLLPEGETRDE